MIGLRTTRHINLRTLFSTKVENQTKKVMPLKREESKTTNESELVGVIEPKALKIMMRVETLKGLLRTYRDNPNIKEDDSLYLHFLTRTLFFMNRSKRKERFIEDRESEELIQLWIKDIGVMTFKNQIKTLAVGLNVLSKMFHSVGYAGPELKSAQLSLCTHIEERLKKGDFDEDPKTLILVLSGVSRLNFSTKTYIKRLSNLIDKTEFDLLGNILDAEHLIMYFDSVAVRLEEHPIFSISVLSYQLKTADTSMKLALCLTQKLDTLSIFQLTKIFEIIASSRLETVSNKGFVSTQSFRYPRF